MAFGDYKATLQTDAVLPTGRTKTKSWLETSETAICSFQVAAQVFFLQTLLCKNAFNGRGQSLSEASCEQAFSAAPSTDPGRRRSARRQLPDLSFLPSQFKNGSSFPWEVNFRKKPIQGQMTPIQSMPLFPWWVSRVTGNM